ncbi:TonB-dependent receptor domain-containing protein [Terriglobus sp. RCC_193]|uniref:TonB-dependent receptor domain-containing protein n=1 Tax=Terriglobus sp. RCC_193 TaxID=3239218 RepID=UPI003523811F
MPLTQWRLSLYAQDAIKLASRLSLSTGLRYQLQTTPGSFANFSPRLGIAWSPDKKSTWVVHLRAGIFHDPNVQSAATEVYRLNGARQQSLTIYSPSFASPLTPVSGSIQVSTVKQFPRALNQFSSLQTHVSVEHTFPHGWHAATTLFWANNWGSLRIKNINAPLVGSSIGTPPDPTTALLAPRPIAPNENILQYQNSGHLSGTIFVAGVDHNNGKLFGISAYYVHVNLKTNTSNSISIPQSSYSETGESSRSDGTSLNSIYASGSLHLPYKLDLSAILDALSGQPYNITTGTDANGDGNFNDRPSYASAPGSGVYSTRFGLLTTNAVNGDVSRNLGTMPARVHLDMNLTRVFRLNPKDKEHPRTLTFNARSANVLNHTNVTAVGTVVSSSTFSQPLSAETARRIELGARFAF